MAISAAMGFGIGSISAGAQLKNSYAQKNQQIKKIRL